MRIREGIGSDAPRMWFRLATSGDEDSKKTAQGWFAAFSPSGREELRAARTLVEWFEEIEGEKSAHRVEKKAAK
jgi:hypothetical protein